MTLSHDEIALIAKKNKAPWILIALKDMEAGVKRLEPGKSHPRILQYWTYTNYNPKTDKESFCAAGMNCYLNESGFEGTNDPAAISFESLPKLKKFRAGSILVFHRDGEEWQRHVTIGLDYDELNGVFYCLGANQGGAVCIKAYSDNKLDSIHWPKKQLEMKEA